MRIEAEGTPAMVGALETEPSNAGVVTGVVTVGDVAAGGVTVGAVATDAAAGAVPVDDESGACTDWADGSLTSPEPQPVSSEARSMEPRRVVVRVENVLLSISLLRVSPWRRGKRADEFRLTES